MKGLDLSNYQSQFSASDAVHLRRAGFEFAFIGRQWRNTWYRQQAEFLRDAEITHIGEYLINVGQDWPVLMPETRYVAVDVEPGSEFVTEQAIDEALEWIRSQGREPLIYSSAWAWEALGLRDLTKYGEQGLPLWNAHYDGESDGYLLWVPFGGWTECAIDQFTERGRVPGLDYPLDLNACEPEFWEERVEAHRLEEDVQTVPLDQGETIATANRIFERFGSILADQAGETMELVTDPAPPTGMKRVLVTYRE